MKVRIVKCSIDTYWYNAHIGAEYFVYELNNYYVMDIGNITHYILKSDCEVIEQ